MLNFYNTLLDSTYTAQFKELDGSSVPAFLRIYGQFASASEVAGVEKMTVFVKNILPFYDENKDY